MNVELRATREEPDGDGQLLVIWCDKADAVQFSIYLKNPYAEWLADFAGYNDARNWAEEVAECHNCELVDYVEKEHEHQRTES